MLAEKNQNEESVRTNILTLARFELLVLERRERIRKELRNERCESSSNAFICKFVVIEPGNQGCY